MNIKLTTWIREKEMKITVCDICTKQVKEGDVRYIAIRDEDDKNKMATKEVCVACAEKVKAKILGMIK